MTGAREFDVHCGGVPALAGKLEAIRLSASEPGRNMTVELSGLTKTLLADLSPRWHDLLFIAAYVLAADQSVERGRRDDVDLGIRWRRQFRMRIAVRDVAFWQRADIGMALCTTLNRLSEDEFSFDFCDGARIGPEQIHFLRADGSPLLIPDGVDRVQLFSGGMDSLGGAAQTIVDEGKSAVLVSHLAANKIVPVQRKLVSALKERLAPQQKMFHVGVRVRRHGHDNDEERTQRTRSLLFAALAGATANLLRTDEVRLFENGVTAINLPISRQVVGARATRTAHPAVIQGFSEILSLVAERPLKVVNPFALLTRGEVAARIAACGLGPLIQDSVSCAEVHRRPQGAPHCGRCSQCVDRQFSMIAAGLKRFDREDGYVTTLMGARERGDRQLLSAYLDAARRYAGFTGSAAFWSRFGEASRALHGIAEGLGIGSPAAADQVYELHRRHGVAVMGALKDLHQRHAEEFLRGDLPGGSVLMLAAEQVVGGALAASQPGAGAGAAPAAVSADSKPADEQSVFRRVDEKVWMLRFRGGPVVHRATSVGLEYIAILLRHPGRSLPARALVDVRAGREPETRLSTLGPVVDKVALAAFRKDVRRLKGERDDAADAGDQREVEKLEREISEIEKAIRRATRPTGKLREEDPDAERARKAVAAGINAAIKDLARPSPEFPSAEALAAHLKMYVSTGNQIIYRDSGVDWSQ